MSTIGTDEFTIILIDDDLPAVQSEIDEVKRYLNGKGITNVKILAYNSGDDIEKILSASTPDMVLVDKSLREEDDGLKVVEKARDHSPLIDILLYSAKGFELKDYQEMSHYTSIQIYDDKTFSDRAKTLIDRNFSKWDDIIFLRGIVISRIIEIELKINEIFANYFKITQDRKEHFNDLILENTSQSIQGKKLALRAILGINGLSALWEGISTKLGKLQEHRNRLAHCKPCKQDGKVVLITMGTPMKYDKSTMIQLFADIKEVDSKLNEISQKLNSIVPATGT
jgi:hypothetical protein